LVVVETEQQAPMKICSQCRHDCKLGARFCLKCGHEFALAVIAPETEAVAVMAQPPAAINADDQPAEASKSCPGCSNPLKPNAKFCGKCGFSFADEAQQTATGTIDLPPAAIVAKPIEVAVPIEGAAPLEERPSCPSCGGTVKENARFCGNCGFTFSAGSSAEPPDKTLSLQKMEPAQAPVLNRPAPRSEPEIRPQVAQHEAIRGTKSGGKAVLMGTVLASVIAVAGGSYWWLKVGNADTPVMPMALTATPAKVELASAVPLATTVAPAPVPASAVEVVAKTELVPAARQSETVKETKNGKSPEKVKKEAGEKSKHSSAVAVHEAQPVPTSPARQSVVPDVAIDAQSQTMLAMADKMYASKSYTSVLDLARPVLKKYPGNSHANRLVNNSRAAIDRQQTEIMGKLKELGK